jgi:hypothetical protein
MARPRKPIDPKKVEQLASIGCPPNEIAAVLGCEVKTIERRFGVLVKSGSDRGKKRIRSKLFQAAVNGNIAAIIFLSKAWLGMRESDPVNINVSANAFSATGLTEEQKKQISRLAQQIEYRVFQRQQPQPETLGNGNAMQPQHTDGNGQSQPAA